MNLPFSKNHDSKSRFFYSSEPPKKLLIWASLWFKVMRKENLPKIVYKSNLYKLSWLDNMLFCFFTPEDERGFSFHVKCVHIRAGNSTKGFFMICYWLPHRVNDRCSSLQKIAHFWAPEVLKLQIFVLPLTSCGTTFLNRDSAPRWQHQPPSAWEPKFPQLRRRHAENARRSQHTRPMTTGSFLFLGKSNILSDERTGTPRNAGAAVSLLTGD